MNYEKMRQIAINGGYDKVLVVENDMLIPKDALQKLLEIDAPIVGGLYVLRHGAGCANVMKNPGSAHDWRFLKYSLEHNEKSALDCEGVCMGCVLIDKSALDFPFVTGVRGAPDMEWMRYCVGKHKMVARLDVQCGHIEPDGNTLWPKEYMN